MAVDDRKKSKSRFSLFLVLSLLAHLIIFLPLWMQPLLVAKKVSDVTVQIKLTSNNKPGDDVPQTQTPPPTQQQNAEKAEQEKKAAQAQKSEKAEKEAKAEKSEQGKALEKSEKAAAKKQEAKAKDEPKKQEPKKAEPKQQEPKKEEPKKQEPKKEDSKKQKQQDAQSAKSEAKKSDGSKSRRADRPDQSLDYSQYEKERTGQDTDKTEDNKPGVPGEDPNNLAYWTKRMSNIKQINEQALQRSIVVTEGTNTALDQRAQDGLKVIQTLTREQKQEFNRVLNDNVTIILKNYTKPKKDGQKYYGEIRFTIDPQGFIAEANFKVRSGNEALDKAMLDALMATRKLELSSDPYVSKVVAGFPIVLNYSDEDME